MMTKMTDKQTLTVSNVLSAKALSTHTHTYMQLYNQECDNKQRQGGTGESI